MRNTCRAVSSFLNGYVSTHQITDLPICGVLPELVAHSSSTSSPSLAANTISNRELMLPWNINRAIPSSMPLIPIITIIIYCLSVYPPLALTSFSFNDIMSTLLILLMLQKQAQKTLMWCKLPYITGTSSIFSLPCSCTPFLHQSHSPSHFSSYVFLSHYNSPSWQSPCHPAAHHLIPLHPLHNITPYIYISCSNHFNDLYFTHSTTSHYSSTLTRMPHLTSLLLFLFLHFILLKHFLI